MTQPTPAQIATELARATVLFQLRAIAAHMGAPQPVTLTPPSSCVGDR